LYLLTANLRYKRS